MKEQRSSWVKKENLACGLHVRVMFFKYLKCITLQMKLIILNTIIKIFLKSKFLNPRLRMPNLDLFHLTLGGREQRPMIAS